MQANNFLGPLPNVNSNELLNIIRLGKNGFDGYDGDLGEALKVLRFARVFSLSENR